MRKGVSMQAAETKGPRHVVVVTHERLRQSAIVENAIAQLQDEGFDVTVIDNTEAPDFGSSSPKVDPDTEIVLVLGGDGTILRAAELVTCTDVPILGINMGHVGFLAEYESFQIHEAIHRIAEHDYSIEERMIAHVDVWLLDAATPLGDWALNDITIERADRGKMVELSIAVDGVAMSSFGCDGIIVSTPTGSTAYAFSAGGPIIWPAVEALLLVPLAAHALFARPIVIGSDSTFSIRIDDDSTSDGWICSDGRRQRPLPRGTRVDIRQSSGRLRLAHLSDAPFTNRLVTKFNLPVVGWRDLHTPNTARVGTSLRGQGDVEDPDDADAGAYVANEEITSVTGGTDSDNARNDDARGDGACGVSTTAQSTEPPVR